jgi:hypothetical protein
MSLCIPEGILKQHVAVLGKTGAGKSSTLRHIVEHLLAKGKRVCIIDPKGDWYGLKSSADGKSAGFKVIMFGDFKDQRASDVPINEHSGKHIAELVASGNRPCVIGFKGWMTSHMIRFWIDFAPTVFGANTGELYIVGDEFHNLAPKGKILDPDAGKCLHWSNRLLSEGRGYGIVCLIASQRPQKVHNDTLTCCETLIAMRVVHTADRGAVKDWLDGAGDKANAEQVLNNIAGLKRGEGYVWSPEIKYGPELVAFPMFTTFDSFAPPQLQKKISASGWADVDLAAVKEKLSAVIEEAKANDPAELRRQIAQLKKDLRAAGNVTKVEKGSIEIKEVPLLTLSEFKRFEASSKEIEKCLQQTIALLDKRKDDLVILEERQRILREHLEKLQGRPLTVTPATAQRAPQNQAVRLPASKPAHAPRPPAPQSAGNGSAEISGGLKRMMIAIAQRPGLTKKQIGVRAGLSSSSGTFGTYLGRLRSNGWLIEENGGFSLSENGRLDLGDYTPLPEGQGLLNYWLGELGGGAQRMLQVLAEAYPDALSKEQLGERAGISATSGTFGTYLGKLRSLELIEGKGELRAAEEFFK